MNPTYLRVHTVYTSGLLQRRMKDPCIIIPVTAVKNNGEVTEKLQGTRESWQRADDNSLCITVFSIHVAIESTTFFR